MSTIPAIEQNFLGDLPEAEFRAAFHEVANWAATYRTQIEDWQISPTAQPGEVSAALPSNIPEYPVLFDDLFDEFQRLILPNLVQWGHPAFLGYFGSTTTAPGILGEVVAATLNVSAMTWRTSPAATELESIVLQWIRSMVQLPDDYFGVVYDTASISSLHALAAARESLNLDIRRRGIAGRSDLPTLRIYTSEQGHSSIVKSAITLGIGEENVVRIPCDPLFRMDSVALQQAVNNDKDRGYLPVAVVATVGTTSTAAIDPVREIAGFCREQNIWLHVDAAYGGAMALLTECRQFMDGVDVADSVVVNPHKWLFVPLDFSALYTRHPEKLRAVFSLVPEYLRGDAQQGETNYMDYGIQLGRRFRALKAWMVFSTFGRTGLVARIREHLRLAKLFAGWIEAHPNFELMAPVEMAVVCFRAVHKTVEPTELNGINESIVQAVNVTGRAYMTHTMLGKSAAMRIAVGNVLTTERHLENVFTLIQTETERVIGCRGGSK